jgi:hypothetical protein
MYMSPSSAKLQITYERRVFPHNFPSQIWTLSGFHSRKRRPGFHKCTSVHLQPLSTLWVTLKVIGGFPDGRASPRHTANGANYNCQIM